jgi:hypothetical protein
MSYAGVIGQNFEIPLQQQVMPQMSPSPLQASQQTDVQGPQLEKGLYEVEGLTKEYYDKWTALNTWAESMQSMGINVTKPDPLNPQSQAAHRWFMKATADLQRHGEALKGQSEIMKQYGTAKMGANGQNITLGGKSGDSELISAMDIQNLGETDMVKRINTDLAKSTNDPKERAALQAQIDQKRGLLEQELAEMIQSGAPEQAIMAKSNEINQLNNATYNDTDRWKELQQNYRAKLAKEEKPTDYTRVELVQRIKDGDLSILRSNKNVVDAKEVNDPRQQGIIVTYKDGHTQFIDYSDKQNMDYQINTALNDGSEGKAVSVDDYDKLMKSYPKELSTPKTVDVAPAEDMFISALTNHEGDDNSYQTRRDAIQLLQESASGMIVPASISKVSGDRLVHSITVDKKGNIALQLMDDKETIKEAMTIDLNTKKGKAELESLISANPGLIDYKAFAPDPLQEQLRFNNNIPAAQPKSSPKIATSNRSDIL